MEGEAGPTKWSKLLKKYKKSKQFPNNCYMSHDTMYPIAPVGNVHITELSCIFKYRLVKQNESVNMAVAILFLGIQAHNQYSKVQT